MNEHPDIDPLPSEKRDQLNFPEAELMIIANLFAAMTCADGVVRDIENFTAQAFLDGFSDIDIQRVNDRYHSAINHCCEKERNETIQNLVCSFNNKQKLNILRSLSAIAASDGAIHPKEQTLIEIFADAMKLDQSFINFTNEQERNKKVILSNLRK